ncbi:hypothetical protein J3R82DRAFT_6267 [Butyriboletus roseoflavus]|nr:hypothetical protein J3R82DRAFT_6267 [Butyriboletus roseoflavus]
MARAALTKIFRDENTVCIELPLKHQEVYRFTYFPEFPGPLTIEVRPLPTLGSTVSAQQNQDVLQAAVRDFTGYAEQLRDVVQELNLPCAPAKDADKTLTAQSDIKPCELKRKSPPDDLDATEPESDSKILASIAAINKACHQAQ